MNIFYKVHSLFDVIRTFKNWLLYLAYRFNLLDKNKERIYYLRNGQKFLAANEEPWGIKEIFLGKEYIKQAKILDNYIVIDIGANIGCFSIFVAALAKNVKVYSYEPAPDTFSRLINNIEINNFTNFIKPFNLGLAGKKGKRKMFINSKGSAVSSIYQKNVSSIKEFVEINVVTLEDIFKANSIEICDFLKIDAEGAEYEILLNASPNYLRKVRNIALEYHHQGCKELKGFLEQCGFSVICPNPLSPTGLLYAKLN